jgi:hypothetical protein
MNDDENQQPPRREPWRLLVLYHRLAALDSRIGPPGALDVLRLLATRLYHAAIP